MNEAVLEKRKILGAAIVVMMLFAGASVLLMGSDVNASTDVDKTINMDTETRETIELTKGEEYSITGTISKNVTIIGNGATIVGGIELDAISNDDDSEYTVKIQNVTIQGDNNDNFGIHGQNQGKNVRSVNLYLDNVTIKDFPGKGMYLTNVKTLDVNNCKFTNNATIEETKNVGDYTIDVNLCGVTGTEISITNCSFSGVCGAKAAIKLVQRVETGTEITSDPATIAGVDISNNDFSGISSNIAADVILGSNSNKDSYVSAFPASVSSGSHSMSLLVGYGVENVVADMQSNTIVETTGTADGTAKTGTTDITVKSGSAVLSGKATENMTLTIAQGAHATASNLASVNPVKTYDNNLSGYDGAVDNTTTVTPGEDDDDFVPPYVPQQSSGDNDTTLYIACCAAAAVVALLAIIIVMNERKK